MNFFLFVGSSIMVKAAKLATNTLAAERGAATAPALTSRSPAPFRVMWRWPHDVRLSKDRLSRRQGSCKFTTLPSLQGQRLAVRWRMTGRRRSLR